MGEFYLGDELEKAKEGAKRERDAAGMGEMKVEDGKRVSLFSHRQQPGEYGRHWLSCRVQTGRYLWW